MKTPLARVRVGAVVLAAIVGLGTVGYRVLDGRGWIDSLYMVITTIAAVGFGERSEWSDAPGLQIFTMLLLVLGIGAAAYTVGGLLQLMAEGELANLMGRRRISQDIERLRGHVVICGFGRIGQILAHDLSHYHQTFVVIDSNSKALVETDERHILALQGDATEDSVLLAAGVEHAKSLVTALPSDADNVFITLTARNLNPKLQIVARAEHRSSERKLKQAGADRVVSPASIGARRMARLITHPSTAELIEQVIETTNIDAELDEALIPEGCRLLGMPLQDTNLRRDHNLLVVGVKRSSGEMLFNPDPKHVLAAGDIIILIGRTEDLRKFRESLHR